MTDRQLTVGSDAGGTRADVWLALALDESRSRAAGRIERGEVTLAGELLAKNHRVAAGEVVTVVEPEAEPTGADGVAVPPIRYEDDHLLVVAKPAGLVVHPGAGHPSGTLVQVLEEAGYPLAPRGGEERPGIVHRLDRDTTGLLVVAKTDEAHEGLVAQLKARTVRRRYLSLLQGIPPSTRGRVEAPIGRDPKDRTRFAAIADGKHAVTHWQVLADGIVPDIDQTAAKVSLVQCRLETGRTHQIRVHMAYAGCPVVGDRLYGARRDVAERLEANRFLLHAGTLGFTHPITDQDVEVTEPAPEDLTLAARRAGIELPTVEGEEGAG